MNFTGIRNILSIHFDPNEIRIVEGKYSKKGILINNNHSLELPNGLYVDGQIQDMDQMAYLLRNGLPNKKIAQRDAYGVINSSRIIMRDIIIPKVEESQIDSILKYQLEDYLPVNPEEYVVKHLMLGTIIEDNVEKSNLLLIGVPTDIVVSHLNLFKNIGLRPIILDYSGNSISKLMKFGGTINLGNDSTLACIDLGYECTSLTITTEGRIEVSRIVDIGRKDLITSLKNRFEDLNDYEILNRLNDIKDINEEYNTSTDEYQIVEEIRSNYREILYQIEMIYRYYKTRELGNDIGLIVIYGDIPKIKGIEELFSTYFDKPCIKLDSLSKVKFNGDLSKYAVAIGGLIRVGEV